MHKLIDTVTLYVVLYLKEVFLKGGHMTNERGSAAVLICPIVEIGVEKYIPLVKPTTHREPLWRLPGGGVEEGESLLDAAQRELKQETGLTITEFFPGVLLIKEYKGKTSDGSFSIIHAQYLLTGKIRDIGGISKEVVIDGDEKLITKLFPVNSILDYLFNHKPLDPRDLSGMLRPHALLLKKHLLSCLRI